MKPIIFISIILGAALMVINIIRYINFIKSTQDVLSSNNKRDQRWMLLSLILLIFFLIGYLGVVFFSDPTVLVSQILLWGSVFVAIVETLMFNLLQTAKNRSIDIAELLVGVIDARDPNLKGHSRYVANITMLFYEYLPNGIKNSINPVSLQYAALMHDVGKMAVPEVILNKPAKLDDDEWKIMKNHPKAGVKILKPLETFENVSSWIEYHHERPDGKGYYGLTNEEIPVAAKIIAIADTYSAITMRRSYKEPKSHEQAIEIIKEVAGTQLDKDLVDIFLTIPREALINCAPEDILI